MRRTFFAFASLCLMAMGALLYACADKELETEPVGTAATRAVEETVASKYYRILPGTSEWRSFKTTEEMWKACQLPEDMLKNLSTDELLEACMEFPMAYDFGAFDDERIAMSAFIKTFNGLTELQNRDDAVIKMIETYKNMEYSEKRDDENGIKRINNSFGLSMAYLEVLMVDESFFKKMTPEELELLKGVAEEKYMMKLNYPDYFGFWNIEQSLMVCAEIALATGKALSEEDLDLLTGFTRIYHAYSPEGLEYISKLIFE